MRAVVCTSYGPPEVLRLEELETPAPRKNELRIRVGATAVTSSDCYVRFGFRQHPGMAWHGVPDENVLCLLLSGEMPTGEVAYHPAFLAGT
jgi:hypothetical protein